MNLKKKNIKIKLFITTTAKFYYRKVNNLAFSNTIHKIKVK